jgi:hypothetical protein
MLNFAFLLKWLKNPFVLGGLTLVLLFAIEETRIKYQKRKVFKLENIIYNLENDLKRCGDINARNLKEFENLEFEYNSLSSQLIDFKKTAADVALIVENNEKIANNKIRLLQAQIKSGINCPVDPDNVGLLKQANRQTN